MARAKRPAAIVASAQVFSSGKDAASSRKAGGKRGSIAKRWQVDAYNYYNTIGEARYAANLFAALAGRAEFGISEPQALGTRAQWINEGPEVAILGELAADTRERSDLVRKYMLHRTIAGECYLIARPRVDDDPPGRTIIWEIVGVTELRKNGNTWEVRVSGNEYIPLDEDLPVIRFWVADPATRDEASSPFRAMEQTLKEIHSLTISIITQVRSRLKSAGILFMPDNLVYPPPPADAVEGGAEAIAEMNDAQRLAISLANTSMEILDDDEVAFPAIIMGDPEALKSIGQDKLIQFWSAVDDKMMIMRSDGVRRFALGMDLPPEQVLGSSGLAVTGAGGSAGSVNHWGVWANEEQTISAHVEPALDDFTGVLTSAFLRAAIEGTDKVVAYDTSSLRLRQDRSKEALELWDRGLLSGAVAVRENGFDPEFDMMDEEEFRRWVLVRLTGASPTPEMMVEALNLLSIAFPRVVGEVVGGSEAKALPGRSEPRSLDSHTYQGPPRGDHNHKPAAYGLRSGAAA